MDFEEWLREIYDREPMADLPELAGVDAQECIRNNWIEHNANGWRVTDDCRRLFGWPLKHDN